MGNKINDVTILISCMHQHDKSIVERSNIQSNVVVVNQCDRNEIERFTFINKFGKEKTCTFISTTERGLSKSRNMAIANAPNDSICLLCDDDEVINDDIEAILTNAYNQYPDADCVIFSIIRKDRCKQKVNPTDSGIPGFNQLLKTSSQQISFLKHKIEALKIEFDVKMGSGTGNGGGEENKFLLDIRRKKGNIYYVPIFIATVLPGESQWFKGYTATYMQNLGWASRRSMGSMMGFLYINYWWLTHQKIYVSDISILNAYLNIIKGYFSKR